MAVIGIMDSGVGGLSVFREIQKLLPAQRYIYYADNANCPYGEKSAEFVRGRCEEITEIMISKGARVMVFACNTATAASIRYLRENYDIPFIGVEPAVKPATAITRSGVVGVLATEGTLKGLKYLNKKAQYEDRAKIIERVGKGFVELVERGELSGPHAEEVVSASLTPLLKAGADTIVLGCTHYPFLRETMEKLAGPEVIFIDPAPAIALRLLEVLKENAIPMSDPEPGIEFMASGDISTLENFYKLINNS